ncbi:MAG: alpha/beta fold hydrolase [Cyanobacteriota bacterium]|nr:alpha/beta fold hydrolase [Cyanobacteriota bacterium]
MNPNNKRNPVLLVHGWLDTRAKFDKMAGYLRNLGWEVHSLDLVPNLGNIELEKLADQVADYADRTIARDRHFDLIGFSMGGIVSRYYVQRLGGIDRVQRFIAISSPHQGTLTGYSLNLPGIAQMRPKSALLEDLNRDAAMLERLNFTSIWTPFDAIILPANSCQMPVGREIKVNVLVHAWMVSDDRVLRAVAEELEAPVRN